MSGMNDRHLSEKLAVLNGDTPNIDQRAVRRGELTALVRKVIEDLAADALEGIETAGADDAIKTFRSSDEAPGGHAWRAGDTLYPPPAGGGGPAVYMPRNDRVGMWLAAITSGATGTNEPRLFGLGSSGQPDDFGAWREFYHEGNVIGRVGLAGKVANGALFEAVVNANGTAMRFANGFQICFHKATLTRTSGDVMGYSWTFPAAYFTGPVIMPVLPHTGFTLVAAIDLGHVFTSGGPTFAAVQVRRAFGAPAFAVGSSVADVDMISLGTWAAVTP